MLTVVTGYQKRKNEHLQGNCQNICLETGCVSPAQEIAEPRIHSQFAAGGGIPEGNPHR